MAAPAGGISGSRTGAARDRASSPIERARYDQMPMDTRNSAERAGRIAFVASLPLSMRQEVEALFFFNPRQPLLHDGIHATVAQSGMPAVVENDGKVWIDVPPGKTQCLFACDEGIEPLRVVGVALYSRPDTYTIAIDHMAIDPDYVHGGENAALDVAMHLVGRVMAIAGSIKGVTRIQLPYRGGRYLRVMHPTSSRSHP